MITIQNTTVKAKSDGSEYELPLSDFLGNLHGADLIYPDGLKLLHKRGSHAVAIYEIPHAVHSIRWIADDSPKKYGSGTKYTTRRLALPYIVLSLPLTRQGKEIVLHPGHCECFVRNSPITSMEDEMFYPPLLNVSKNTRQPPETVPLAWLCTQYLDSRPIAKAKTANEKLWKCIHQSRRCLLESGFNYSSEHHEGNSHYSDYAASEGADERIKDVKKWEKASITEPNFVLGIKWKSTEHTIEKLIGRTLKLIGAGNGDVTASSLEAIVFNKGKAV